MLLCNKNKILFAVLCFTVVCNVSALSSLFSINGLSQKHQYALSHSQKTADVASEIYFKKLCEVYQKFVMDQSNSPLEWKIEVKLMKNGGYTSRIEVRPYSDIDKAEYELAFNKGHEELKARIAAIDTMPEVVAANKAKAAALKVVEETVAALKPVADSYLKNNYITRNPKLTTLIVGMILILHLLPE